MNGALTIGTLDGANAEIAREVGSANIYIFGLTADQVVDVRNRGSAAREIFDSNRDVHRIITRLLDGTFSAEDRTLFSPIVHSLLDQGDFYLRLADYGEYAATHEQVAADFQDADAWASRAILNVARSSRFSSDRTIREYANDIWDLTPVV